MEQTGSSALASRLLHEREAQGLAWSLAVRLSVVALAVLCRPRDLNQAFMSLMVNGFEAMDREGTLRLRTHARDGHLEVTIADTGRGMEPDQLASLFEIGFADKSERVGMGLGLPMAQRIIESHQGSIGVQSTPGQGSSFVVRLPIRS